MTRRATPWIHTAWGVRFMAIVVGACTGVLLLGMAAVVRYVVLAIW